MVSEPVEDCFAGWSFCQHAALSSALARRLAHINRALPMILIFINDGLIRLKVASIVKNIDSRSGE